MEQCVISVIIPVYKAENTFPVVSQVCFALVFYSF